MLHKITEGKISKVPNMFFITQNLKNVYFEGLTEIHYIYLVEIFKKINLPAS